MSKAERHNSATTGPIDANTVGIRELRDHLSRYLERVKAGETLTITEHGMPIARIVGSRLPPRLAEMIARGEATAATRPLSDLRNVRPVKFAGDTQDLIDEIRG
jgi:prevent-host-death family protein